MWPVVVAAAVAGTTSLVAKHFLNQNGSNQDHIRNCDQEIPVVDDPGLQVPNVSSDDGIFRFSSSGPSREIGNSSKKSEIGRLRKAKKGSLGARGVEVSRRRFAVCFKRRKTAKNVSADYRSCSSKDSALVGLGLGVGIMCMMSAGKDEIRKLNKAMDETAKVVQEFKSEFYRRKSSRNLQRLPTPSEVAGSPQKSGNGIAQLVLNKSTKFSKDPDDVKMFGTSDDGECASSVLTEEPQAEVLEMDELEAQLEFELQKLPWCTTDSSCYEGLRPNLGKTKVSGEGFHEPDGQISVQFGGVLPSELNQKLCHLQIEQQENQIVELESELHLAHSKLQQKEAELQALKDCVKRLTKFSLSSFSDDETEAQEEKEQHAVCDYNVKAGCESRKSMVGMKRPIDC
ncbi:hypothetical protein HS088_TW03G00715 [Tripterygium wilfordii]|uniref:Uncharacterized protein n=1 Tax=Tripterygium wilfordii TaxID=458696 RepID=A0A7J7DVQ3_TRIWF|nr:uncharacterized protein LOC119995091 isoform X2 [Tripterygium wilfordii]KAF5750379.1 hypothetical protein HS088_TW03G00715 [Tripterygium wilfordii]